MKVLQIINSLGTGGAEKLIVDAVPLYQKEGVAVDVLCLKNKKTEFWRTLEQHSNGKITGLTLGSVYNPLLIIKMIPFLKKYDIIHAHLFPTLYWTVLAKYISFSNVKIVYTEHNTSNRRQRHLIFTFLDRWIYRRIDIIGCITEEVKENLQKHLDIKDSNRFQLIKNGVLLSNFIGAEAISKKIFFEDQDFIIIQVSSFREQKDQFTLIRSLLHLDAKFKLLLVGDGNLRKACEELVLELELENRVKFLGNRADVPQLLKMSDIVVLSSFYEGLSLSSIEGMSVKPFIASDVPGLRDIVGGYGLLFKQGSAVELAEKILELSNDKVLYNTIAQRCFERAQNFDIHKMVDAYIQLYRSIKADKME